MNSYYEYSSRTQGCSLQYSHQLVNLYQYMMNQVCNHPKRKLTETEREKDFFLKKVAQRVFTTLAECESWLMNIAWDLMTPLSVIYSTLSQSA